MTDFHFIGRNIREIRRSRKWTQEQLGQKLRRRKLSRQAISWIESGKNTDLETIADIAATLRVSVNDLTTGTAGSPTVLNRRDNSPAVVKQLLTKPSASWATVVAHDERYDPVAILRLLLEKGDEEYETDPVLCRTMRRLAAELSETGCVPPELTVEAMRDLANITSRIGEHDEALRILDRACPIASRTADPEYQFATLEFARAIVFTNMQQRSNARTSLLKARSVFEASDRKRYLRTFHLEAVLESYTNPANAKKILDGVIDEIASWGDEEEVARVMAVFAFACEKCGLFERALECNERAAAIHRRHHRTAESAKDVWRIAVVHAEMRHFDLAFTEFTEAKRKLLSLGLEEDVLFLDLNVLRAKVASGANHEELMELSRRVAERASAARLPVAASEAIDWLRRISADLTESAIDRVEAFIREAEVHPELRFQPPEA